VITSATFTKATVAGFDIYHRVYRQGVEELNFKIYPSDYKEEGGPNTYRFMGMGHFCLMWSAATSLRSGEWSDSFEVPPTTWRVLNAVMDLLRDNYFSVGKDAHYNQYKSIHKYHRHGSFYMPVAGKVNGEIVGGNLEFAAEVSPGLGFSIKFFTELGVERGRGRYDTRDSTMPCLMRLKTRSLIRKVSKMLEDKFGAVSGERPRGSTMAEDVLIDREYCWHRKSYGQMHLYGPGSYKKTREGDLMTDGMMGYFKGYCSGAVLYGQIFDNLNGMVKACAPGVSSWPFQINSGYVWARFPGVRRYCDSRTQVEKIKKAIERHVKAKDFLRAHSAQQALEQIESGSAPSSNE
jgi:hypothetical protein